MLSTNRKHLSLISQLVKLVVACLFLLPTQVVAKTDLVLSPQQLSPGVNQTATVTIGVDTTVKIFGADMVIKYDPTSINVVSVEAGTFWQKPQVIINRIDNTSGKVFLSVFSYPATLGNGNLANLKVKQTTTGGGAISIDNQTIIAGEGGQKISYVSKGASVTASGALPSTFPTNTISPNSLRPTLSTPIATPTTTASTNVSASVVALATPTPESSPVILLEQSPTPAVVKTKASIGFTLQLIALFLLIFGTLAFFTFKKNF